jgi:hypothetical protein
VARKLGVALIRASPRVDASSSLVQTAAISGMRSFVVRHECPMRVSPPSTQFAVHRQNFQHSSMSWAVSDRDCPQRPYGAVHTLTVPPVSTHPIH